MKLFKIYFSPTGGVKKILDIVSSKWNYETIEVDLSNAVRDFSEITLQNDDLCIVAVPSFGGRVPGIALSRLKKIKGHGASVITIVVYGNRAYEDTLLELNTTLQTLSYHCIAAITAVSEHSILHQFGTGRPDEKDRQELLEFSERIQKNIQQTIRSIKITVPGQFPYREYNGVPLKPKGGKNCTKCGICVKECPMQAIPKDNPSSTDKSKCISCMRCISLCPQHARNVNKILSFVAARKMRKACISRKENQLFL